MRPSGSPEMLERRRHRAMALLQRGHQPVEVAVLSISFRELSGWGSSVSPDK